MANNFNLCFNNLKNLDLEKTIFVECCIISLNNHNNIFGYIDRNNYIIINNVNITNEKYHKNDKTITILYTFFMNIQLKYIPLKYFYDIDAFDIMKRPSLSSQDTILLELESTKNNKHRSNEIRSKITCETIISNEITHETSSSIKITHETSSSNELIEKLTGTKRCNTEEKEKEIIKKQKNDDVSEFDRVFNLEKQFYNYLENFYLYLHSISNSLAYPRFMEIIALWHITNIMLNLFNKYLKYGSKIYIPSISFLYDKKNNQDKIKNETFDFVSLSKDNEPKFFVNIYKLSEKTAIKDFSNHHSSILNFEDKFKTDENISDRIQYYITQNEENFENFLTYLIKYAVNMTHIDFQNSIGRSAVFDNKISFYKYITYNTVITCNNIFQDSTQSTSISKFRYNVNYNLHDLWNRHCPIEE